MSASTSEHLGNLKAKNFPLTEFAALLMHTQKEEGQEYVSRRK